MIAKHLVLAPGFVFTCQNTNSFSHKKLKANVCSPWREDEEEPQCHNPREGKDHC